FPGQLTETKLTAFLTKILNVLLLLAWKGIPFLLFTSLVCFYFNYSIIGKVISYISLSFGLGLFLTLVVLYSVKSDK
ncbi:MAG TPA: hypothetical protein VNW06_02780, partial [Cytophagaceae bacterium]|nr:hypothetical protein [Cytophagaceae bacterium]